MCVLLRETCIECEIVLVGDVRRRRADTMGGIYVLPQLLQFKNADPSRAVAAEHVRRTRALSVRTIT